VISWGLDTRLGKTITNAHQRFLPRLTNEEYAHSENLGTLVHTRQTLIDILYNPQLSLFGLEMSQNVAHVNYQERKIQKRGRKKE